MSTASPCLHAAPQVHAPVSEESLPETVVAVSPRTPARPLRAGAAWVVAGRFLGIAVTMLVNFVLAQFALTRAEYGEFIVISSMLGSASLLAMFGMNSAVVRFVSAAVGLGDLARARQSLRLVSFATLVSVACVGGLLALVLSFLDTRLIGLSAFPGLVPMLVASLMLLALLQFVAEACRSLQELKLASLLSGGQTGGLLSNLLFLTLIAGAVVVARPGLRTAIALNLAAMAITLPVAVVGLIRLARERLSAATSADQNSAEHTASLPATHALGVASLLSFALPMLAIQLLTSATAQGDLWIAGVSCPLNEVALYGAARRVMLLIAMPLQIINFTVIASIAELHSQGRLEDLQRLLRGAATIAASISIAAGLGLILFGRPTLNLLFGHGYGEAAPLLSILVIGQMFLACAGSSDCALSMTGHQIAPLVVNTVCGLLLAVLGIWAVRHYGTVGLAYVSAAVIAVQAISLWLLARRLVGVWTHPAWGRLSLSV
jgi:O-antigen/teichoic acid export membrane protein